MAMLNHLRRSLLWGCTIGVTIGVAEALSYYFAAEGSMLGGLRIVTTGFLLYLAIAIAWSVPAGLALGLASRLFGKPDSGEGFYGALHLALGVTLAVLYWVNVHFLGGFLDLVSLLVDAGLLLLAWPLLTLLLRRPFRLLARSGGRRTGLLVGGYWAGLVVLALSPQLGDDPRVGAAPPTAQAPEGAPNVLFLLIDTLRADHLSCYGYERPTSPRIDQLAAEGVLFENCISQAPHTKQSTASILTSLYPPTHRMDTLWSKLSSEAKTMPQLFHEGGWRTSLLSANSFLSPTFGFGRGVEYFEGSLVNPALKLVGSTVLNRFRRVAVQEFQTWAAPWDLLRDLSAWSFLGGRGNPYQHGMDGTALRDEFLEWQGGLEGDRPWFALLQFMEPHAPYDPEPEHRLFDNPPAGSEEGVWFPGSTEITFLPFKKGATASEEERQAMINNYDACIHEADAYIGEILDELERRGALENTLVVITSDHGEEFYDHGGWGHGQSLHNELLQVPLILRGPGIPSQRRVPGQVRSVDILPTLLHLCDLEPLAAASGEPLNVRADAPARDAYSEVQWGGHWAVSWRDPEGTLIQAHFNGKERRQLFEAGDRAEAADLLPGQEARMGQLFERMTGMREEYRSKALQAAESFVDDGMKGNLHDLGYVDNVDDDEE